MYAHPVGVLSSPCYIWTAPHHLMVLGPRLMVLGPNLIVLGLRLMVLGPQCKAAVIKHRLRYLIAFLLWPTFNIAPIQGTPNAGVKTLGGTRGGLLGGRV